MSATPGPTPASSSSTGSRDRTPGRIMSGEMAEQPAVLRRILDEGAPRIREIAEQVAARDPRFVLLTARGTSDNAALYAKYLLEILLGKPCGLTSMSTTTAYGAQARPDRRPRHHRQPVRRLSRPGGLHQGRPRGRRDHARRHQQLRLAARGGLRVPHRRPRRPGEGAPGDQDLHRRLLALYLFVEGLRGGDGALTAKVLPELAESDPGPPGRGQGARRRATASPSGWCSPRAATAIRRRRRRRSS